MIVSAKGVRRAFCRRLSVKVGVCLMLIGLGMRLDIVAQIDNTPFYDIEPLPILGDSAGQQLSFHLDYLGYNRNREYFEQIADGYTLFGNQLLATMSYRASPAVRLEAGIFLNQDFGNPQLRPVQPYLRFLYEKEHFQLIFGHLAGQTSHRLIEPLQTFERLLTNRWEQGAQFRYQNSQLFADVWIDWVRMIYPFSNEQEIIEGGFCVEKNWLKPNSAHRLETHAQFFAQHRGGQIDTLRAPVTNWFNAAMGAKWSKKSTLRWLRSYEIATYWVHFLDHSPEKNLDFEQGSAAYTHAGFSTIYGSLYLSHWNGRRYFAPAGDDLFSSISRLVTPSVPTEEHRHLLLFRLFRTFDLGKRTQLVLRAEPYYNFNTGDWNFSTGFYIRHRLSRKLLHWQD
jgi:hypothetical protein